MKITFGFSNQINYFQLEHANNVEMFSEQQKTNTDEAHRDIHVA